MSLGLQSTVEVWSNADVVSLGEIVVGLPDVLIPGLAGWVMRVTKNYGDITRIERHYKPFASVLSFKAFVDNTDKSVSTLEVFLPNSLT